MSEGMEEVKEGKKIYSGPKSRIPEILSLAMLKMEKNFIAVIDKGYCRQPYSAESGQSPKFLLFRLKQELVELEEALERRDWLNVREELSDISNLCDYIDEQMLKKLMKAAYGKGRRER